MPHTPIGQSSMYKLAAVSILSLFFLVNGLNESFAAGLGDAAYRDCGNVRSIFGLVTVNLSPDSLSQTLGRKVKLGDVTRRDLEQNEEKIFFCNDIASNGNKLDRAEIHRKMDAVWEHIHKTQIVLTRGEVEKFRGRILVPEELNRLALLKHQTPELSSDIDAVVENEEALKSEADAKDRLAKERSGSDKRIAQEKTEAEQKAEEARAEEKTRAEAEEQATAARDASLALAKKIENAAKKAAFAASIPQVCREADKIQAELQSPESTDGLDKAVRLAAAGDNASACKSFSKLARNMEAARSDFVNCSKAIEANPDPQASSLSQSALSLAVQIHSSQVNVQKALSNMACQSE